MLRPCLDKTEISIRSSASNIGPSPLERPGVAVGQLRIADRVSLIAPVTMFATPANFVQKFERPLHLPKRKLLAYIIRNRQFGFKLLCNERSYSPLHSSLLLRSILLFWLKIRDLSR
jgi:hypothetical protein